MQIGLIDLDTSHPASWLPVLRDLGHEVIGVYDSGDVHPPGYAAAFADEHNIPNVYEHIEELAESVDLGIVHGCNWDMHVPRARPLVERNKAVLIDKPMAGRLADLDTLLQWAQKGARITGGSALRLCNEAIDHVAQHGRPTTAVASCGLGAFDYGIHAYALLMALMDDGFAPLAVRSFGDDCDGRVIIDWPDGRSGIVITGNDTTWMPFQAMTIDQKGSRQFTVDGAALYEAYLRRVLPYLAGDEERPPVTMAALINIEKCAIAARVSKQHDNERIVLKTLEADCDGFDGAAFAQRYRSLKYPVCESAPQR